MQPPTNPIKMKQEQIIRQHLATLSEEDRQRFNQMNPPERHEYLSQRNLILRIPIVLNQSLFHTMSLR